MKKMLLLISVLLIGVLSNAQKVKKQEFETKINSATVYLTGAEIIRTKKTSLKQGRTELVFKNISPKINNKSIRVTTTNGAKILSISSKINYLTKEKEKPRITQLKDSLLIVSEKIQLLADKTDAYKIEKQMLLENISIGGENNGVSITNLKEASDFYRTRTIEINVKLSKYKRETIKLNSISYRLNRELNELNANNTYTRSEIIILVSSDKTISSDIEVKYLVYSAGWSPAYDIKAEDTDKPVEFIYRAKVFNNTDIDWKDLKMTLSTADPTLDVSQPNLQPWYMDYNTITYNNHYQQNYGGIQDKGEGYIQSNMISTDSGNAQQSVTEPEDYIFIEESYAEVAVPELNAEFEIEKPYTIPSDDKPYLVDVNEYELPATFKHFAVTKLDKDVFLLARITGWENLNLVEGPANVYYSGTYLGQSFIKTRNVSDTLDLSLGRDGKVMVTRSKLKDYSKTQFIGNKRKDTYTYELVAKNNRKSPINIEILDQIPISQNADIEVKILEISNADYNETKGELKWKFKLNPGEMKRIRLSYSIKYPKRKQILYRKQKSRNVRFF